MGKSIVSELTIQALAMENLELRERNSSLEADVAVYRELTTAAFDGLRDMTLSHDRLRGQHHALQGEYRAMREERLLRVGADENDRVAA